MTLPLFHHQQDSLDFLFDKPEAAIFAGLGTGKTRIIFEDAKRLDAALFVVCPKSAIPVWARERQKWGFGIPITVWNYERIWRPGYFEDIERRMRQDTNRPAMLVLDESHRIKDRTTKQSRAARRLSKLAQYRRVLTGTPVVNGYQDLWAQMDFLNPTILGKWSGFADEYLTFHPLFNKVIGVRNLLSLQSKIAPYVFHVRTEDVIDLPAETSLYREFELPPKARAAYNSMEQDLFAELDEGEIDAPNALVKILRLAQITGGFVKHDAGVDQLHGAKLDLLAEIVEELDGEQFVVFARFRAEIEAIRILLEGLGLSVATFTGDTPLNVRALTLQLFEERACQALVLQIQAGSASIDLTPARYAVYYSVGWAFGDYEQSRGRIRRVGQTRPQFYVHLQARDTIDEVISTALAYKQGVHEAVRSWWRRQHGG